MAKQLMAGLIVLGCVFVVYLLTSMPPREETASPERFEVPSVTVVEDDAMQLYKSNCLSCHGGDLEGRFGPALSKVGSSMSIEAIYKKIANGGGGMPKFDRKLTEEQLILVANWLAQKQ